MINSKPQFVVTFHTTAGAMATERLCRERGLPGKLTSVPRVLTPDCGIAWSAPPEAEAALRQAITAAGIEVEGFYQL